MARGVIDISIYDGGKTHFCPKRLHLDKNFLWRYQLFWVYGQIEWGSLGWNLRNAIWALRELGSSGLGNGLAVAGGTWPRVRQLLALKTLNKNPSR